MGGGDDDGGAGDGDGDGGAGGVCGCRRKSAATVPGDRGGEGGREDLNLLCARAIARLVSYGRK